MARSIERTLRVQAPGVVAASLVTLSPILGILGALLFWSYPGRPRAFLDDTGRRLPGSIAERSSSTSMASGKG